MHKLKKQHYSFCFRRWTRKSYASFNSMHKVVKIGVLRAGLSLIAMSSQNVFAQTDTLNPVRTADLDEVVIIGQREDALPVIVRTLSAISQVEIERSPTNSLNELLRFLPSTDLRQRGPLGVQADISVRGGNFDQTQVLLNGVNFTDSQTGHYSLNIPIDLISVSKIEILQGLSAPGAIGGSLNITTENQPINSAKFVLSGGQHEYLNMLGNATVGNEKFIAFLSASHQESKGYIANTDFQNTNLYSHFQYFSNIGKWEAQIGFQDKAFGANGFYTFAYPDQFEENRTLLGSLRWKQSIGIFNWTATFYHRRHFDRFELFRSTAPDWYSGHNYHQSRVSGGDINTNFNTLFGQTTLNVELRDEYILSNVLGHTMGVPKPVPFEAGEQYTKDANRTIFRAFFSQGYEFTRFALTGGVSFHHSNDFGSKFCFAGDVRYKFTNHMLLYIAANQSLRLPTFTDLFYQTATHDANPDLKPEEAVLYEFGWKFKKDAWSASSVVFYREGKNIIDWVYTEGNDKSQSHNYSGVNAKGAELSVQWQPAISSPKSVLQQVGFGYTHISLDKENAPQMTSYVLDYLKHKVNFNLSHTVFFHQLKALWNITFYDRAGAYVNSASGATTAFRSFSLVDLKLTWDEKRFSIFLDANNLFGVSYFDYGGLLQPKCWFTAGLQLKI